MSLQKSFRNASRRGTNYSAVVVDVHGSLASARLSQNGAIVHNIPVIGGPLFVGQLVQVDYTTGNPRIVAYTNLDSVLADRIDELSPLILKGGGAAGVVSHQFIYELPGPFVAGLGGLKAYNRFGITYTVLEVHCSLSLPASGNSIWIEVYVNQDEDNYDSVTDWNGIEILVGEYTAVATGLSYPFNHNEFLTVEVWSGAGSDLSVVTLVA
jgi:hypothetical protein